MIPDIRLSLDVTQDVSLHVCEDGASIALDVDIPYVGGQWPVYDGTYVVVPKAHESQTLETEHKSMTDDVTVFEIPYSETVNEYGKTVAIGS